MNHGEKSVEAPGCEVGGLFTQNRVLSLSASQHPPTPAFSPLTPSPSAEAALTCSRSSGHLVPAGLELSDEKLPWADVKKGPGVPTAWLS